MPVEKANPTQMPEQIVDPINAQTGSGEVQKRGESVAKPFRHPATLAKFAKPYELLKAYGTKTTRIPKVAHP